MRRSLSLGRDAKQTEFCTYLYSHSAPRSPAQHILQPVVGRSCRRGDDGPHHRQGGHRRRSGQGVRRLQVCLSALLERPADATISLMLGRHRSPYSRAVGVFLVAVFALTSVTASICPVCLAKDFLPTQHTAAQNLNHHPDSQDCDRDGCSCCGFHFLAPTHDLVLEPFASTPVTAASIPNLPPEVSSGFYRPPRA